jgi:hypothetical protein
MEVLSKFDELRIKTGRQLVRLLHNQLELGIREARHALRSADTWALVEHHYLSARGACGEASRLMSLVGEIPEQERGRLQAKLSHLREMLEGLAALGSPNGDTISALARALWKARDCPEGSPDDDWFRAERVLQSHTAAVGN